MSPRRLLIALLLTACGPQTSDSDVSTTGTATTATPTDTTDTPTTGGPQSPAVCDEINDIPIFGQDTANCIDFATIPPTGEIEVGVINQRDEPVFLRGFGNGASGYLRVTGAPGDVAVHYPFVCQQDPQPCDEVIAGEDAGCLLNDKLSPPVRIEPGQRYHFTWEPFVVFPAIIPAACQPDPDTAMAVTCTTGRPVTLSDYTLEIAYSTGCDGACTCDPGPDGGCILEILDTTLTGTPVAVQANYDGVCTVVDLVID